uniref:Uncharacterized protein n=1 Tax=Rhizophora mucronata TaxID=61149 RepID=A0A2P2NAD2_RHIMU
MINIIAITSLSSSWFSAHASLHLVKSPLK